MNRGGLFLSPLPLLSLVFVSFGAVAACSSDAANSSPGGACANYIAARRDGAKECGRFNISPARESTYLTRLQRSCENALAAPGIGITPGLLDQCSARVRSECGDDDACEDLFDDVRGTLAEGAPCEDDTQCASGECDRMSNSSTPAACGKCAPSRQIGEPCSGGGCVVGAACRTAPGSSSPTESKCVAVRIANAGESCGSFVEEVVRCAQGLTCKLDETSSGASTGKCTAPAGEGAPCGTQDSQFARCAAPFSCVNEKCGRLGGAGATCSGSDDCASGFGCDPSNRTCVAITWVADGAACDDNLRRCNTGFCARPTSSGSSTTGTCVAYIADGQPCDLTKSSEQRCDSQASCRDGVCTFNDATQCK